MKKSFCAAAAIPYSLSPDTGSSKFHNLQAVEVSGGGRESGTDRGIAGGSAVPTQAEEKKVGVLVSGRKC